MSLNWKWSDKYGEVICKGTNKEWKFNIYGGNALAIFIYEWKEEDIEQYQLQGFFCDKDHAKRCLGISKGTVNIYKDYIRYRINVNHPKGRILAELLVKAYDNVEIELYKGDNEND